MNNSTEPLIIDFDYIWHPPALRTIKPLDYIGLVLNGMVVTIFAQRLIRKTPRNVNFRKWNRPRQYEFVAFIAVVINEIFHFIIIICQPVLLYVDSDGFLHSLGNHESFGIISILAVYITATCLVFASLYRYERLLTVVRGTQIYKFLQGLRGTMLLLAITSLYAYLHDLFFDNGVIPNKLNKPVAKYIKLFNGVVGFITILFCGIVDLTSNVLMTRAVLYSLPRTVNEPTRYKTFKRRLISLVLTEIFLTIVAAAIYAFDSLKLVPLDYIHFSILSICPVYVSRSPSAY